MEELKNTILDFHGPKFTLKKNVHSAKLYEGGTKVKVYPNKHMSESRKLVRHLSTILLFREEKLIEVQTAVNHEEKKLYVSSNKAVRTLKKLLPKKLKDVSTDDIPEDTREARHAKKLAAEIINYGDYDLVLVNPAGSDGEHAETKILREIGINFDYIGGTRRPCTACFLYMQIMELPTNKYNPHHGAYWNSIGALSSLKTKRDKIYTTHLNNKFYYNHQLRGNDVYQYDTDSE